MDSQGKGLIKALETWAKKVTSGYRDVNVRDMSVSFRDGLAFCAIIHHHRPDLIDFDSLSKENILDNNQIAFSVAEKQLGVPALLDAEDMVQYSRPDRLSIITYLSQLHNCFVNQNKVKSVYKRIQSNSVAPPSKILATEPKLLSVRRIEVCQVCNNRVFILERLIVENKLYHTACFRCCKCNSLLNPGAYVESDIPGKYECSVCLPEEKFNSMDTDDTGSHSSLEDRNHISASPVVSRLKTVQGNIPKSPLSDSVNQARTSFLQRNLSSNSNSANRGPLSKVEDSSDCDKSPSPLPKELSNGVSVRAKISVFESNRSSISEALPSVEQTATKPKEISALNTTSSLDNSINKSPRPSTRLSLLSPSISDNAKNIIHEDIVTKTSIATDEADSISPDSNKVSKISPESSESASDKLNCDNVSSSSKVNAVPTTDANISSLRNSAFQFRSLSKDVNKSAEPFTKTIGDYRSPLKTSRDIFQTNIQPLKLTIPSINTTSVKESTSLPITPIITSPDFIRSPTEVTQVKPTYTRTLTRPLSYSSLSSKERTDEAANSNISSVIHSKWSKPRRSSLDSDSKGELNGNKLLADNSLSSERTSADNVSSLPVIVSEAFKPTVTSDKVTDAINTLLSPNANKITPIPSVRRSLEVKKLEPMVIEKNNEIQSPKSSLSSPIAAEISEKEDGKTLPCTASPVVAPSATARTVHTKVQPKKSYPGDLNPFGEEENDEEEEYPDDLNPFGDDEEPPKVFEGVSADNYDESKNPFASDEEEAESVAHRKPSSRPPISQNTSPFRTSPTGSLRGTTKKRIAPKPPKLSEIFPNGVADCDGDKSFSSLKSSPALIRKPLQTPSPKLRKNKPAPPPPPVPSPRTPVQADVAASVKHAKDEDNMKLKSSGVKEDIKKSRQKKRPAPPVPIPMRKDKVKIPLKEILREMKDIETKQRDFEKQGREIELLIRDRDKDEEPSVEEEEYIMQLFELVNQKNALFRRQAELMYIKRSQRLEEQQEELEKQIRELMAKPENEKSEDDKTKEDELINELTDIVDQRNCIIDSIEMDRRRELEEDVSVQEQIEIKNGDLPIAAEIKEKGKVKGKKDKKKKDKKDKHQEGGDSGRSTLKKKLFK